ncbi:MAG: hypothetical protein JWN46_1102 [Acidimicrobiales bacterium]|nr:hypothetical protein [Acidimicrobiales bacterium]
MERRIGERHRVAPAPVRWRGLQAPRGVVGRLRGPACGELILDNLSVSGAGFVGPADNGFAMNLRVEVELGGRWGLVQLMRIRPTNSPKHLYYGVAFVTQEPLFMEQVVDLMQLVAPMPSSAAWR